MVDNELGSFIRLHAIERIVDFHRFSYPVKLFRVDIVRVYRCGGIYHISGQLRTEVRSPLQITCGLKSAALVFK